MSFILSVTHSGDLAPSSILDLLFTSTDAAGIPTVLAGTPVVSVYKANSLTQSTTGVTLDVDYDGVTGLNHLRVDTSADGTFYSAGSDFSAVITTGTVGGSSVVGYKVGSFSLNHEAALRPTTAGNTLDVSATGEAGLDFANIKDATGAHTLTNITVPLVTTVTGNVSGNLGGTLTSTERTAIADALLTRNMASVTPQPSLDARTVLNALRPLRNKKTLVGTLFTVYQEDDASAAWSGTATLDSTATPVTALDPA
jgi:hypothetical protein